MNFCYKPSYKRGGGREVVTTYLVPEVRIGPHLAADLVLLSIFEAVSQMFGEERI